MNDYQSENISIIGNDIPIEVSNIIRNNRYVSVDIETTGLDWSSDELATIQFYSGNISIIYQHNLKHRPNEIISLLEDENITKHFHHAMFDMRFLMNNWEVDIKNICCTKIASKILHPNRNSHSLKSLLEEYLNISIDKDMQLSDWKEKNLSKNQVRYALNDVKYLQKLYASLEECLINKNLHHRAFKCFDFSPTLAWLQVRNINKVFEY